MNATEVHRGRILIAGGSGFIGRSLARRLDARGYDVVILTRSPKPAPAPTTARSAAREVAWDGRACGEWWRELDGAAGLVNLTGRSVNCRPTPENWRQVLNSRLDSINALGEACRRCVAPPPVWVQAATLAIYGDTSDEVLDESAPIGVGHAVDVGARWEGSLQAAVPPNVRRVILRIGLVLGRDGGALATLGRITRWGLGGSVGTGRQFLSWIHEDDMCRLVEAALKRPDLAGAYNACTPGAVTNAQFMRELRRVLRRPWCPPAPALAVKFACWVLGTDARLALTGRRCHPRRLLEAGFTFHHPNLGAALDDLFDRQPR